MDFKALGVLAEVLTGGRGISQSRNTLDYLNGGDNFGLWQEAVRWLSLRVRAVNGFGGGHVIP